MLKFKHVNISGTGSRILSSFRVPPSFSIRHDHHYMRPTTAFLRPSSRVLEYLIRKGRIPSASMALVEVQETREAEIFEPPPKVAVTPCDPWPRPYYFEDNLRRVAPYHFTYNTYCKERWRGRGLLEIFTDEFRDRPVEYYVCVIEGRILRAREGCSSDTVVVERGD